MSMKLASVSGVALATALALTAATPSAEAGGSLKDTYVPAPVAMWAGCYFGGHVGGAWRDEGDVKKFKKKGYGSSEPSVVAYDAQSPDGWYYVEEYDYDGDDDASFIGGIHKGCNWQDGDVVYGIEGDISFGDSIDYLASLRGRLGIAADNLLLYLTAGVAFIGMENEFHLSDGYYEWSFKDDDNEVGLVIGAGLEKKLDPNWSIGVEGLYYFFGDDDNEHHWYDGGCNSPCDYYGYHVKHEKDNDIFVVRARLSYHFGEVAEELEPLK